MRLNILFSLVLFFWMSSDSFSQNVIEIGYFTFNEGTPEYNLHKGDGQRTVTLEIKFTKIFPSKPEILFTVEQIDCSNDYNTRYHIEASLVTRESFLLKIKTWQNSRIYAIRGKWMAISTDD